MQILIRVLLLIIQIFIISVSISYSMKTYRKWISPLSIYTCINSIALLLCLLNLLNYYGLDNFVIMILILSELTLFVGDIFGNALFSSIYRRKSKRNILSFQALDQAKVIHRSMHIISMIAIIGAIVSAQRVFKNYNLSFLLKNPAYLQFMGFQQQYVGYMNVLGIMVFPMFCYYFIITKQIKFFDIICVSLAFLGLFLAGIKTYIVISVITALLIYVQLTPKIRIKYILIATVVCIGFFIFYENYIDIYKTPIGSLNFSSFLKSLEAPYSYITSGWVAFSHFGLEGTGNVFPYKGYVVLSSVFKILSFLGLTDKEPFQPLEFVSVGEGIMTNVYTMVGEVYLDVGPIGLAVVYFILGTICSYVYNISLKERNLSATFISALLMYGLFISFFSYYYHFHLLFLCVSTYAVISISKYTLLRKKEEI